MAISVRYFLFEETGALKLVPQRVSEALTHGNDAIPGYANTTQRVVSVVIENEGGKPARILDATGQYWTFDGEGKIREGLLDSLREVMNFLPSVTERETKGTVVDLRPELKRKQWLQKSRWSLSSEDLDRIAAHIFPGLAEASKVESVKGKAPRRPPLTHEARSAMSEVRMACFKIDNALTDLSEPGLKGLAHEARLMAASYDESTNLWAAVAAEADLKREIKRRHRIGDGVWYGLVHIYLEHDPSCREEIDTLEAKCNGRPAAVKAVQDLLAKNAHRFSEKVTLETELLCDLEWTPINETLRGVPTLNPEDSANENS